MKEREAIRQAVDSLPFCLWLVKTVFDHTPSTIAGSIFSFELMILA